MKVIAWNMDRTRATRNWHELTGTSAAISRFSMKLPLHLLNFPSV